MSVSNLIVGFASVAGTYALACWQVIHAYRDYREERGKRWEAEDRADRYEHECEGLEARNANLETRIMSLERQLTDHKELAQRYEQLLANSGGELYKLQKRLDYLSKVDIGGTEDCPHCERLRKRIRRFFEQKKKIKAAYVENVMMVSHGQCDPRALVDAERYLLVDDDNEIRTFGEIRDDEIERSLRLLRHVKNVEAIQEKTSSPKPVEQTAPHAPN